MATLTLNDNDIFAWMKTKTRNTQEKPKYNTAIYATITVWWKIKRVKKMRKSSLFITQIQESVKSTGCLHNYEE